MSDRPVRPEWRAAYLSRTLAVARRSTGPARAAATRGSPPPRRTQPVHDSLPMSIAAMLRPVPTA
ncbi:MAG: hypothetical protein MUF07_10045 [Steroidobacteraceae bacterium]|jgi:hypothetical protein|nr:hypothetical protein [Steroidobacteraceae bacterium]